jgi:DNA-binding transcriptional ArsR family regulator
LTNIRDFLIVREMSDDDVEAAPGGRDYELDDELDVGTPDRLKALGDPLRGHICDLVLERAMSVTEIAERVGRPRGSVAYHVDVLVDAGLLQVTHTRRVRAVDERFYGRTARTFLLPDTPGDMPLLREMMDEYDHDAAARLAAEARENATADDGAVFMTYRRARIPVSRAADYARRLNELALEFVDERRGGDVEFGLFVSMFPTNRSVGAPADPTDTDTDTDTTTNNDSDGGST